MFFILLYFYGFYCCVLCSVKKIKKYDLLSKGRYYKKQLVGLIGDDTYKDHGDGIMLRWWRSVVSGLKEGELMGQSCVIINGTDTFFVGS